MNNISGDYRTSHASRGYGAHYQKTYERGYYAAQWRCIEAPLLRRILEKSLKEGKSRYLDFACGTGRIMSLASTIFSDVSGVDVSEDMAQHAAAAVPGAKIFAPRDITKTPLEGPFDVITAFRFFLNAQPTLRREVLISLGKMQTVDGLLICNVHVNTKSILGRVYQARNKLKRRTVANILDIESFRAVINEAGYTIEDVYYYSYFPRIGSIFPSMQEALVTGFEKINFLPTSMAQSFLLVCRKSSLDL